MRPAGPSTTPGGAHRHYRCLVFSR